MKVIHLTSVHTAYDTRIFQRECKSLADNKFDVILIVAFEKKEFQKNGIQIKGIAKPVNRFKRFTATIPSIYRIAMLEDADIYHFHDPELISIGLLLKRKGKKVIYDVHEDLPRDIYYKPWIPKYLKPMISKIAEKVEIYAAKRLDAVVTSTPLIAERFKASSGLVVDVKNYPFLQDDVVPVKWKNKESIFCYISSNFVVVRAIREVIKAMKFVDAPLILAGNLNNNNLKKELSAELGWNQVNLLGWVGRQQVVNIMKKSVAGLSLYYPTATNYYAIPTKMFEYMMAGIPVIGSNLPYETEIINKYRCGICVDPFSPEQIADAMNRILNNPEEAEQMGLNGRDAVENEFNWKTEELKLLSLYRELLE